MRKLLFALLMVPVIVCAQRRLFMGHATTAVTPVGPAETPYPQTWWDANYIVYADPTSIGSTALWTNRAYPGTKDLTQTIAGSRPVYHTNILNSKPGVLFDGSDDVLVFPALSGHTNFSVMAVVSLVTNLTAGDGGWGVFGDIGGNARLSITNDTGPTVLLRYVSDDNGDGTSSALGALTNAAMFVWVSHGNTNTMNFYENGTNRSFEVTSDITSSFNCVGTNVLGSAGHPWDGYVHEIIFWTNSLTDLQVSNLWANTTDGMSNKWFSASTESFSLLTESSDFITTEAGNRLRTE